ncbi:MAG TPA: vWA domain-containing protein [Vicinamibacterales bacterium]|jgi:Flp pilus assembly protein TadG
MKSRLRSLAKREDGVALIYIAVTLTAFLLFTGLAVDSGRGYVVKAALTKAVDGAALAAARELNSGSPQTKAAQVFKANFPSQFLGTVADDPTSKPGFYNLTTNPATGVNVITINATAVLPTTFMSLGNIRSMTVAAAGQATRRMVDLSLVVDVSGSIGSQWATVRDATRSFIDSFDAAHDRLSLTLFSTGSAVLYAMPSSRGFDKAGIKAAVPNSLPSGSTLMAEGMYRGWDQLRTVPNGSQSGLRIIVLFTDGASNGVPGQWGGAGAPARSVRTEDFPDRHDPDSQTHNTPNVYGVTMTDTVNGGTPNPNFSIGFDATTTTGMKDLTKVNSMPAAIRHMPPNSWHSQHTSSGIPTTFPFVSNTLQVNGRSQSVARSLITDGTGTYPTTLWNVNNAARNLLEIIADAARTDAGGDYPIRIYTIGMGNLANLLLGTIPETPASMLQRVANDKHSPDFNAAQLPGAYFYAPTAADVSAAYEGIQNQILRLSK